MDTATTTTETPPAPPQVAPNCPNCGSHVMFAVELDYDVEGGFAPDHFGVTPEVGDTISRCDDCGRFFVHVDGEPPAGVAAPTREPEAETASTSDDDEAAALKARVAELEQQLAAAEATAATPDIPTDPPTPS